jgi:hypothetical protein
MKEEGREMGDGEDWVRQTGRACRFTEDFPEGVAA